MSSMVGKLGGLWEELLTIDEFSIVEVVGAQGGGINTPGGEIPPKLIRYEFKREILLLDY